MALLQGRVLNVSNCFKEVGLSNIGREMPRMIEVPFGVEVSRTPRAGKSRHDNPVSYTDYRLNTTEHNQKGIELMKAYVEANGGFVPPIKRPVGRPSARVPEVKNPPKTLF